MCFISFTCYLPFFLLQQFEHWEWEKDREPREHLICQLWQCYLIVIFLSYAHCTAYTALYAYVVVCMYGIECKPFDSFVCSLFTDLIRLLSCTRYIEQMLQAKAWNSIRSDAKCIGKVWAHLNWSLLSMLHQSMETIRWYERKKDILKIRDTEKGKSAHKITTTNAIADRKITWICNCTTSCAAKRVARNIALYKWLLFQLFEMKPTELVG